MTEFFYFWLNVLIMVAQGAVIHVSVGTVSGSFAFLCQRRGPYWSRGLNSKYLFKCQRPAVLVGGFVNERTDGVHVE